MCSNYQPVTHMERLLTFFGVDRAPDLDPSPSEIYPLGLAPFIRLREDGSGNRVVENAVFGMLAPFAKEIARSHGHGVCRSVTTESPKACAFHAPLKPFVKRRRHSLSLPFSWAD